MNLRAEAKILEASLQDFAIGNEIPRELLSVPDHLAVQAEDITDFEERVKALVPHVEHTEDVITIDVQGRFLTSVKIAGGLSLGMFAPVRWVQVLEPKSPRSSWPGPDHLSFYYADLDRAESRISSRRIRYSIGETEDSENPCLRLVIDAYGHELRITDEPIEEFLSGVR